MRSICNVAECISMCSTLRRYSPAGTEAAILGVLFRSACYKISSALYPNLDVNGAREEEIVLREGDFSGEKVG